MRKLLWDAALALTSGTLGELHRLERWQRLSPEASRAVHERRLTGLLVEAARHVPWYRRTLHEAAVVDAQERVSLERFGDVPFVSKDILRSSSGELVSERAGRRTYWNTSGGSTGEPVRLLQDQAFRAAARAAAMLFNTWADYRLGSPMVKLWGSERDLFVGRETMPTRAARWLRNEVWLNAFRMTPTEMREHVATINRVRPVFVLGYVESLYDLSRWCQDAGVRLHSPGSVMSAAGPLTDPVRSTIQAAFGAPVFDRYGSREVGDIACECGAHQGLHVCPPHHLVELVDAEGRAVQPGEEGEIVVTLLTNRSMPLIRFRIGDIGVWADRPCACGCPWPLLRRVTGRVSDIFVRADGTRVHGEYFTHLFYFVPWVAKFQVVQDACARITVLLWTGTRRRIRTPLTGASSRRSRGKCRS